MVINIEKLLEEKSAIINKTIEKFVPRKYDLNYMIFTLGPPSYKYNEEAATKAISEPVWDFLDRGGKRWRPVLFLLVSEALGLDPEKFLDLVLFPELIHNGTIIIDDIEDMSRERRGKPALHLMFGEDIAINAGNALYFLALLPLLKNKEKFDQKTLLRLYEVYTKEMTRVSFGQATDIAWHKGLSNADNVTE
jgi:geranylgeranyl pyrophosphate synthase